MSWPLILIDGLPGSGKSTLAAKLAERFAGSVAYDEMDPENPLHVVPPGELGAAFEGILGWSPQAVAERSLDRWRSVAQLPERRMRIFESYPFQSGIRLLLQLDGSRPLLFDYFAELERIIAPLEPRLIYLTGGEVRSDLERIAALRGEAWRDFIVEFLERSPWARNRGLSGQELPFMLMAAYADIVGELLATSAVPRLAIAGGAALGPETTEKSVTWIAGQA